MANESDLEETTGGGFKRPEPSKTKKFFKTVGKGAKGIGSTVAKGTGSLIKKAKEAQSPEGQERRLEAQEQKLIVQERLAQRRARIAKLKPKSSFGGIGGGFLGGSNGGGMSFKPLDMGNVLTGSKSKKKGKGKAFNPFSQF